MAHERHAIELGEGYLAARATPYGSRLIRMPTGTGRGVIAVSAHNPAKGQMLVLAPSRHLNQAAKRTGQLHLIGRATAGFKQFRTGNE